jgi:hypothetical protein
MNREQRILSREQSMRLFLPLHQDDSVEENRRRGTGRVYCTLCGHHYRHHPYYDEVTYNSDPVDHRLCDGDVVHL